MLKNYRKKQIQLHANFVGTIETLKKKIFQESMPKLIFFNNFGYTDFDRAASFEVFDFTSQTAIMLIKGKYILCKIYYELTDSFHDKGNKKANDEFPIKSLEGDLYCFFINPDYEGGKLNDLNKKIKCYTTAKISGNIPDEYFGVFEPFPLTEFNLTSPINPEKLTYKDNPNVLLVTNLLMYEYLVFMMFVTE